MTAANERAAAAAARPDKGSFPKFKNQKNNSRKKKKERGGGGGGGGGGGWVERWSRQEVVRVQERKKKNMRLATSD